MHSLPPASSLYKLIALTLMAALWLATPASYYLFAEKETLRLKRMTFPEPFSWWVSGASLKAPGS